MKRTILASCLISLFTLQTANATEPVIISDASPPIANTYDVGDSTVVIYTMTNNVPGQIVPISITGISAPVTRTAVAKDCGNVLPAGPSTCNIGIRIGPTVEYAGQSINQNLTINYLGRLPLIKNISFSVKELPPPPPKMVTINVSTSFLGLAVNGIPRTMTLTATDGDARDVNYYLANELPAGTTITPAKCGDILRDHTCVLTITPGPTPTATAGETPHPIMFKIQGENTNVLIFNFEILTTGNIYQQGYIYSIDDTTPATGSVGGATVSLVDNNRGIQWYNGDNIITNADSVTDGAANTIKINNAQGTGNYAAAFCASYQVDIFGNTPCQSGNICYSNWYLPAICELGPDTNLSGCAATTPNIVENLVNHAIGGFSNTSNYWSSTEFNITPSAFAWYQFIGDGSNGSGPSASFHGVGNKYVDFFAIRCARAMTY